MAVAAAVGRNGSTKLGVAAAGVMVVQRKRWIGMKLMKGRRALLGGDDEGSKKKVEEMGRTKELWCQPPGAGVAFAARRWHRGWRRWG